MNEMRKLMESVQKVYEGLDPTIAARQIFSAYLREPRIQREVANSNEFYRAMVYLTGVVDAAQIDGTDYWAQIIDALEKINLRYTGKIGVEEDVINEGGNEKAEFALNELRAAMDAWHNAVRKFQNVYDPSTVGLGGWIEDDHDVMYDIENELDDPMDEAYQGGKTEHSGAKKGKGAFYGRKKEAKRDSNKNRRKADKAAVNEADGFEHGYRTVLEDTPVTDGDGETYLVRATEYRDSPHARDGVRVQIEQAGGGGPDSYFLPVDLKTLERMVGMVKQAHGGLHEDQYSFPDNHSTEYDDEPGATKYTRRYGNVTVDFDGDEVLITHGHGENIFLTMEEWKEFAGEIQDILI